MTYAQPSSSLTIVTKQPTFGAFIRPSAVINGQQVPLTWGPNVVGAAPGVHHIAIHMPWIWRFGQAEITVDNRYAPAPPVYYAMPWVNFGPGAIGFAPVKSPRLGVFLAVLITPLALITLCCLGATLFSNQNG